MGETFNTLEAAKRLWPNYRIESTGTLAVVMHCSNRVQLCQIPIEAISAAEKDCCKTCARNVPELHYHQIVELKPSPAPTYRRNASLLRMMNAED